MAHEIYCFEFGEAERNVGNFLARQGYDVRRVESLGGVEARLSEPSVSKRKLREAVRKALNPKERVIALHQEPHLAYALAKMVDTLSDKFCYVHISPDSAWHGEYHETVRRSHFIPQLLYDTNARESRKRKEINLVNIGAFNHILSSITDWGLRNKGLNTLEGVLSMTPKDAYVLVDFSVLSPAEFSAEGVERGTLTRQELFDVLQQVKSAKDILGATIVVYGVAEERNGVPVLCAPEKDLMLYKEAADLLTREAA
ncbi:MAG: hypothetical protein KJ955_06580 [Nanoarchaeota archaeon]|nr:hypothetical protein [Nanoarchaeota archaeon]